MKLITACFLALMMVAAVAAQEKAPQIEARTPAELVTAYDSLADAILGTKQTEKHLVESILAATYRHAEGVARQAMAKAAAGQDAKADLEKLAALVSQLGNEGDAAVAAVRKRLVEGGHHHHSSAEAQRIYDTGFVVVTKNAKKNFLNAAAEIGRMAQAPRVETLKKLWADVAKEYEGLFKSSR